jgi:hydroxyacylglutathione hydrolase
MKVLPVPCLADNYAYLLVQDGHAVVVDPSEAGPVLAALDGLGIPGLVVDAVWCTHHHVDHVGGVPDLVAARPAPVVGSRYDLTHGRIPGQTVAVDDGDTVPAFGGVARIVAIPGHTLGAIAFVLPGHVFTGDTLFAGGCGRVFEGTMPMMQASLAKLRALDPALRMWCGHEYTVKNLEFAEAMDPAPAIPTRLARMRALRKRGEPTVGTPLADEHATNPFLRWDAPALQATALRLGAPGTSPAEVFAALRGEKDRW